MPRGPIKSVDKARDFKGTIKKLLKYIKSYRLEITTLSFPIVMYQIHKAK